MANDTPPNGAPICWGRQYEDGSDECRVCNFNTSCRPAAINAYGRRSLPVQQPVMLPQPRFGNNGVSSFPAPMMPPQQQMLPQPQQSMFPRSTLPQPQQQQPPPQIPPQPHAPVGWNNPVAYLNRPGPPPTPPASFPWWQYSGETTPSRLGKNVLLSVARALFGTLFEFFTNWTWPTKEDRR